jgi:hypothetical protein
MCADRGMHGRLEAGSAPACVVSVLSLTHRHLSRCLLCRGRKWREREEGNGSERSTVSAAVNPVEESRLLSRAKGLLLSGGENLDEIGGQTLQTLGRTNEGGRCLTEVPYLCSPGSFPVSNLLTQLRRVRLRIGLSCHCERTWESEGERRIEGELLREGVRGSEALPLRDPKGGTGMP